MKFRINFYISFLEDEKQVSFAETTCSGEFHVEALKAVVISHSTSIAVLQQTACRQVDIVSATFYERSTIMLFSAVHCSLKSLRWLHTIDRR